MNLTISSLKRNINYHTSTISHELFRVKKYAFVKRNPGRKPIRAIDKFLFKYKSYFLLLYFSQHLNDTEIYKILDNLQLVCTHIYMYRETRQ